LALGFICLSIYILQEVAQVSGRSPSFTVKWRPAGTEMQGRYTRGRAAPGGHGSRGSRGWQAQAGTCV
jgi:hypothetical protein